jgi:hypothetical protein
LQEALDPPYFELLHDLRIEPACKTPFYFGFEDRELSRQELRAEVLRELLHYQKAEDLTSRESRQEADLDHSTTARTP